MTADDGEQTQTQSQESGEDTDVKSDNPKSDEEYTEEAREQAKAYEEDRPTVVLPGSDNTVTGTAVSEWLDDDGNPKFGKEGGEEGAQEGGQDSGQDDNG